MSKGRNKHRNEQRPPQAGPVGARVIPATSPAGFEALREGPEPVAGKVAVPVLFIALLGLLIYVADTNMIHRGGGFDPQVYYPFQSIEAVTLAHPADPIEQRRRVGRGIYTAIGCVGCHQATGLGQAGTFPPLAGSEWVVAQNPNRLIRIVLNGLQGPIQVAGNEFNNNAMVPWKDILDDQKVADVLTYIRSEWGNKAPPVTPEQVKKVRAKAQERDTQWTADELKAVPEQE
jgi:mono/diheme cytochrome c family protein